MNAVFCEEILGWEKDRKVATCSIKIYNYTARARAYTILVKWPENKNTALVDNNRGGRKEAKGIDHPRAPVVLTMEGKQIKHLKVS